MNHEEIIAVLKDLYTATSFRMSLHDKDFNEIAAYPESRSPFCSFIQSHPTEYRKCRECDENACRSASVRKGALIYKCRYGLTEAISPLYNFGTLTGFLMMGQVADESVSPELMAKRIGHLVSEREAALKITEEIPTVPNELAESYVRIMTLCARYLTLSNAMTSKKPTIGEAAKKYILENLSEKITIGKICEELGTSKSSLLSVFKKQYGMTVGDFITNSRLDEAKRLLELGEHSINEIAHETGFYDQSYFSKVFSQECGCSPSEYRKNMRSAESEEWDK